jgi:hypothetical protein
VCGLRSRSLKAQVKLAVQSSASVICVERRCICVGCLTQMFLMRPCLTNRISRSAWLLVAFRLPTQSSRAAAERQSHVRSAKRHKELSFRIAMVARSNCVRQILTNVDSTFRWCLIANHDAVCPLDIDIRQKHTKYNRLSAYLLKHAYYCNLVCGNTAHATTVTI